MMKRTTKEIPAVRYDPEADRRADDRPSDAMRGLWLRSLKPTEVVAGLMIGALVASLLGLRFTSISNLDERVMKLEKREEMRDFILCALARETTPQLTPPDCQPIFQAQGKTAVP